MDSSRDSSASLRQQVADSPPRSLDRARHASRHRELPDFDPIVRLRETMRRETRLGLTVGFAGALFVHSAAAAHGFSSLLELGAFTQTVRNLVEEDVAATVAVEVSKPPLPPPLPAEPVKPEPAPPKPPSLAKAPPPATPPTEEPPPAPAQAGKVLTAPTEANEPLDLTDQGFVTGEGDKFAGGITAASGTSTGPVYNRAAKIGGIPGGTGTSAVAVPSPAPKVDLSKPATPASTNWDDCGFPPEADVEQIDFMRVSVVVTVGTNGRAENVSVLKDPGYGFGRLAKLCALRKTFNVGLDSNGRPTTTVTPPIVVRFTR